MCFCQNLSARIVVENYGNWRVLGFSVKGAYVTGVWDAFIIKLRESKSIEGKTKDTLNCLIKKGLTIGDLVEKIDLLYEIPSNKPRSPANLLMDKVLKNICPD